MEIIGIIKKRIGIKFLIYLIGNQIKTKFNSSDFNLIEGRDNFLINQIRFFEIAFLHPLQSKKLFFQFLLF